MKQNGRTQLRRLATMAVLTATSIVLFLVFRTPIFPAVPFLVYEAADVGLLVAGFSLGPWAGLACTAVVCVLQAPLHPEGGWFGAVMHFYILGRLNRSVVHHLQQVQVQSRSLLGLAGGHSCHGRSDDSRKPYSDAPVLPYSHQRCGQPSRMDHRVQRREGGD